jgi:hypothetical protein
LPNTRLPPFYLREPEVELARKGHSKYRHLVDWVGDLQITEKTWRRYRKGPNGGSALPLDVGQQIVWLLGRSRANTYFAAAGYEPNKSTWSMEALETLAILESLPAALRRALSPGYQIVSWAEVLPCSLEDPVFMKEHHRSIFDPSRHTPMSADDSMRLQDGYNTYGDGARRRFEDERARAVAFDTIMFESDLMKIGDGGCPEYGRCSQSSRLATVRRVREWTAHPDKTNARLLLIDATQERRMKASGAWGANQRFDSVIIVRDADRRPVFTFWRELAFGRLGVSANAFDLASNEERINEALSAARDDAAYTGAVLSRLEADIDVQLA